VGRKTGLSDAEVAAISGFRDEDFTEAEQLLLHYADQMTATPVHINDQLFDALQAHFNDDQLLELTADIAHENFRARFNHALEIGSDNLYCPLPGASKGESQKVTADLRG
jgi:alkylhydroperoxidase family enzyme